LALAALVILLLLAVYYVTRGGTAARAGFDPSPGAAFAPGLTRLD
jgi:hypothetical protein